VSLSRRCSTRSRCCDFDERFEWAIQGGSLGVSSGHRRRAYEQGNRGMPVARTLMVSGGGGGAHQQPSVPTTRGRDQEGHTVHTCEQCSAKSRAVYLCVRR
jgi:hypothetical protein